MFFKIAGFEFRYQLRQPAFWVIGILFALIGFGAVASDNVGLGAGGNVHKNAPYVLAILNMIGSVFFMLATTAIVANVVARDAQSGFGPMIQSTRVTKFDYLYGRFLGAFGAVALAFLAINIGALVGLGMPWVDAETVGPLQIGDFLWAYLVMGLPSVFVTSALFFALATATRSMMATYVGVVAIFILYMTVNSILDKPQFEGLMAWLDPFGGFAYEQATKYFTPLERNTINPSLNGTLGWNRVLWTAIGAGFLIVAYAVFQFSARGAKPKKAARLAARVEAAAPAPVATGPLARPSFGLKSALAILIARTRFETVLVFKSPAYAVLVVLGFGFAVATLLFMGEIYGAPVLPVTRVVIGALAGAFGLISMIVAIYYSGELVWRDRERKVHEIIDASAAPDWSFLIPKTLALALVLISTLAAGMLAGIAVQTFKGWFDYRIDQYLAWYLWPSALGYVQLAILAIFVQALSPNKFVGWAVMVVYLIATMVAGNLGFDHMLYRYAQGPGVPLSDMNGTGAFGVFAAWADAYWLAFGVVLLVVSYALWRRGTETRLMPRLKRLPSRLMGPAGMLGGAALAAFVGLGVFIFINTNVWNEYQSRDAERDEQAAYEKALLAFETVPQPAVSHVRLNLDLYPHQPRLVTDGEWTIENRTDAPLSEIHLRWIDGVKMEWLEVQGARIAREWKDFDYRIYRFDTPMQPGEKRTVRFRTVVEQRGFKNRGNTTRVVGNGTFITNSEFSPIVGMSRDGLLTDRTQRRKRGLPAELRMAKLEDETARGRNYIGADWTTADITVTTEADQTPIAPGTMTSDTTRNGRRTAHFVTETPVLNFFSVQSARYEATRRTHDGLELVVYHDPLHTRNVDRMLKALAASLDYFSANFSPYQFRQARITEFPDYDSYAQSFPNTFAWSEGLGFITDLRDPEKIDYVTYVAAHEFAHQWWAHQVVGSNQQGATSLSESQAQYSALMVMERLYGRDQIRRFLKQELDGYLSARGQETIEELPLGRVENQGYIHYQKGGLVMYLLRDQIGEAAVNGALRQLIADFGFKAGPYPRSTDLVAALRARAPADKQGLITDLFERITLYDVKAVGSSVAARPDGQFDVSITVEARKLYVDGKGEETEAPMSETMDVGLFTAQPGEGAFNPRDVVLMERRTVRTGSQTFRFVTARRPTFVGVDPYNKWIDRDSDDNVKAVG